jgi:hypothetical protein
MPGSVMPTRSDIEAGTPRCQAARREPTGAVRVNFGLRGGMRPTGYFLCLMPMRYRAGNNTWICECGSTEKGEVLGARAVAFAMEAEAA